MIALFAIPAGIGQAAENKAKEVSLIETLKTLIVNSYFDMLTMIYVLGYLSVSLSMGVAVYYFMYIMGDANLFGTFMTMYSIPSVVGLIIVPFLVKKFNSIRNVNFGSFIIQMIFRVMFVFAASGFDATAAVQSASCNNMLIFMFAGIPLIVTIATAVIYYFLKVEKVNKELRGNV